MMKINPLKNRRAFLNFQRLLTFLLVFVMVYSPIDVILKKLHIPTPPKVVRQLTQTRIAHAATAGPTGAGGGVSDTNVCSDNMNWGPITTQLQSDDTSYVEYTGGNFDLGETSDGLVGNTFGFSTSGTIDGIQVEVINWTSVGSAQYKDVILMSGGSRVGNDKENNTVTIPTTDPGSTYKSWGGVADTWGAGLTSTQVNDSTFGVQLCYLALTSNVNIHIDQIRITVTYTPPSVISLEQVAYRWFSNVNSTAVGNAGGYNATTTAPEVGTPIRLRLLFHVEGGDLSSSGTTTKIQVGEKPPDGCPAATFSDVSGTTDITWIDNTSATDGAALTSNVEDPTHAATTSSHALITQTYNESNNFTNSQGVVDAGADMLFDFAFSVSTTTLESAKGGKTYCFRAVQEGGESFDNQETGGYTIYPVLVIDKPIKTRLRGVVRLRLIRLR